MRASPRQPIALAVLVAVVAAVATRAAAQDVASPAGETPPEERWQETLRDLTELFALVDPPPIDELASRWEPIPALDELLDGSGAPERGRSADVPRVDTSELYALARQGRAQDAIERAVRQARASLEAHGPVSFETGESLCGLAGLLEARGEFHGSELSLRGAVAALLGAFGPSHPDLGTAWHRIAAARMIAGDFERAERCTRLATGIHRAAGEAGGVASGLHNLGMVYATLGELDRAESLLERSLAHWRGAGDGSGSDLASCLYELGRVARMRGDLLRAEPLFREALALRTALGENDAVRSQSLAGLAALRRDLGDLEEAEALYRDALLLCRRALGPAHHLVAVTSNDLAVLLTDKGQLEEARHLHEEAIAIHRATGSRSLLATSLDNLAQVFATRGDFERSEALFLEALALYRDLYGPRDARVAVATSSLSAMLLERDDFDAAETRAREALDIATAAVGPGSTLVADVHADLGAALHELGRLDDAAAHLEHAIDSRRRHSAGGHPRVAAYLARLGSIRLDQGRSPEGAALLRDALAMLEAHRARVVGAEPERARFAGRVRMADVAAALVRAAVLVGAPDEAATVAEQRSGRPLLDLVARSERDVLAEARRSAPETAGELEERLAAERAARSELFAEEAAAARLGADPEALRRVERARQALREAEANVLAVLSGFWPDARPAGVDELRAGLAPGEVLVYAVWSESAILSLAVPAAGEGEVAAAVVAPTADDVARLAAEGARLREELARAPETAERAAALEDRLAALGAKLFPGSVGAAAAGARRVVVVPDGPLVGLPVGPMVAGLAGLAGPAPASSGSGPPVGYATSGTLHLRLRGRRAGRAGEGAPRAVVVGDPAFERDVVATAPGSAPAPEAAGSALDRVRLWGGRLEPLLGTRDEARGVADALRAASFDVELLVGEAASLARLEPAVVGARVLHLATHGLVGTPERPYDASLALAAPERPTTDDFGFLTLERLVREWRGRLRGCEMVVLSACDTSRGARVGDSLMALPWGFFYAGAPTVVASLWRVDDAATAYLMRRFHENLAGTRGAPLPAAAALDEAQRWLRSASRRDLREAGTVAAEGERGSGRPIEAGAVSPGTLTPYTDPYYWAGFVVLGDAD